jgi:hypothetical protein
MTESNQQQLNSSTASKIEDAQQQQQLLLLSTSSSQATTTTTTLPSTSSSQNTNNILLQLKTDERFQAFLQQDFSASKYASEILSVNSTYSLGARSATAFNQRNDSNNNQINNQIDIQKQSQQLQEGIQILEKAVKDEVLKSYDVLMAQLLGVESAEEVLIDLRDGVKELHESENGDKRTA